MLPSTRGLLFFAACSGAAAWGPDGHATVAHLATHFMEPKVLQAMNSELGNTNLTKASTWCDDYDHTPEGKWSEDLHFINYKDRACAFKWERDCPDDWCNVGTISNYTKQVFDRSLSAERRQQALFFVLHMTGDLHQPLHVSRVEDQGGNKIKISYDFSEDGNHEREGNLHAAWDGYLIEQGISDLDEQAKMQPMEILLKGGPPPFHDWPVLAQSVLKRMTEGNWSRDVAQWRHTVAVEGSSLRAGLSVAANETAGLSCSYGYAKPDGTATESGDFLDRSYFTWAWPVVEIQLAKAGARLAQILSDAFEAESEARAEVLVV